MKTSASSKGVKYDGGKLRIDLIPPEAIEAMAVTLSFGANKYGERNWEKGIEEDRLWAAAQRHLWAWLKGHNRDGESDLNPLWHALTSIAMLIATEQRGTGTGDKA
jgi:hypothetical protein